MRTRQGRGLREEEGTLRARAGERCPREGGREDRLDIPVELRPGRLWRKRGIPELPEALRATQWAGWGARLPPAVCGACLELVQGAEAEVRLLRQGRLPLLAAARGSERCSTESAFTG